MHSQQLQPQTVAFLLHHNYSHNIPHILSKNNTTVDKEIGGLQFVSHLKILPEKDRDKLLTYKEVRDIIKSQEGGICI